MPPRRRSRVSFPADDWRPLNGGLILHLHRLLFGHMAMLGWAFKTEDNLVVERSPDGSTTFRFQPVPAVTTPFAIDDLIKRYKEAAAAASARDARVKGCGPKIVDGEEDAGCAYRSSAGWSR